MQIEFHLSSDPSYLAITVFAIGTAAMLFMAAAIILFVAFYQKRMLQEQLRRQGLEADHQLKMLLSQIKSQENERRRVAKDLHDDVGLMIQALRTTTLAILKDASDDDKNEIQELVTTIDQTVRRICWDLMPSSLERFGLADAIDEMCTRFSTHRKVSVKFFQHGNAITLNKEKRLCFIEWLKN